MRVPTDIIGFLKFLADLSDTDIGRYASGAYGIDNRVAFCRMVKSMGARTAT